MIVHNKNICLFPLIDKAEASIYHISQFASSVIAITNEGKPKQIINDLSIDCFTFECISLQSFNMLLLYFSNKVTIEEYEKAIAIANEKSAIIIADDLVCSALEIDYSSNIKTFSSLQANFKTNPKTVPQDIDKNTSLEILQVPVILNFGTSEKCNKSFTHFSTVRQLQKLGYKVLSIVPQPDAALYNAVSFPQFMFDANISAERKTKGLNSFVYNLVNEYEPDICIVTLPGGIIPINSKITYGYGLLGYEVLYALSPDSYIMNVSYEEHTEIFFDLLLQKLLSRFGISPEFINISNHKLLWEELRYSVVNFSTLTVSSSIVDKSINDLQDAKSKYLFCNSINNFGMDNGINVLIEHLSQNTELL